MRLQRSPVLIVASSGGVVESDSGSGSGCETGSMFVGGDGND